MKRHPILILLVVVCSRPAPADRFTTDVKPLLEASCVHCHDGETETGLDLSSLGHDFSDPETFRGWERVFDRIADGEMPPKSEGRPDAKQLKKALTSLRQQLMEASREKRDRLGRVPARRLTKSELRYTLQDLLSIESDVTSGVPDEIESGSFDTVGTHQRISAVHMESYLAAAAEALEIAINLKRNPYRSDRNDFSYLKAWHEKPLLLGGSVTRPLKFGSGYVLFAEVDYLTHFQTQVTTPGTYRLAAELAAYQSEDLVTAKFIVKDQAGGARLVKAVDLRPGDDPRDVIVETFMKPGEIAYVTCDVGSSVFGGVYAAGGAQGYKGEGLAVLSQRVEGPLFASWPPESTVSLLDGIQLDGPRGSAKGPFRVGGSQDPEATVRSIVSKFASRAFRRPSDSDEVDRFAALAKSALNDGRDLLDAVKVALRSILSSPQFLLFSAEPGELDDYALASRLSYFLWKSMPDDELFALAEKGRLSDASVLAGQVERMLADEKFGRFVNDFLGQWLRLRKVNATTPDDGLYPEYDELLSDAIPKEPELFFGEVVKENMPLDTLIDSDFTFVNARLAKLYGIEGVQGQQFRKVDLPNGSPRGGVLTQAAILKTTANGTTTSPVTRGNFVLTNFLGTPPSPPPPGVGSVEPDTRGKTTIREILASHRDIVSCNQCHREIDPPGFALESFDPIGGFRTHYRTSGGEQTFGGFTSKLPPKQGRPVDSSGVTPDGKPFAGIVEFKQHLLGRKEQVARNFVTQLVVHGTGGKIEFADRNEIESILDQTRADGFPVKDILHAVIQSPLFRNL